MKNLAASVRQRLLQLSRQTGEEFNRLLVRYAMERLLYRLSRSGYQPRFILKGAVLFTVWQEGKPLHRATKDLDLAGREAGTPAELAEQFQSILALELEDDGLRFEPLVKHEPIRLREGVANGVRLFLVARLAQARIPVHLDIGFGDDVFPEPREVTFPTLLPFPAPHVQVYQRETVVAEKLHAWLERGGDSSRMKDLFDLRFLAEHFAFEGEVLQESIRRTLTGRRLKLGPLPPYVLSEALAADPDQGKKWKAFLSQHKLPPQELAQTVPVITGFLLPLLQALQEGSVWRQHWAPGGPWR